VQDNLSPTLLELRQLELLMNRLPKAARFTEEGCIKARGYRFPVYSIAFGPKDPEAPTVALIAGVHGLERIGTSVVLAFMQFIAASMEWDETLHSVFEKTRLLFYPIVNPAGMQFHRRSNMNGVDLMRHAPITAENPKWWRLYQGHRVSKKLPWYQGHFMESIELEFELLDSFVKREILPSKRAMSIDVHSGYGRVDRLWYPYAHTTRPFPQKHIIDRWECLLDRTLPHHIYKVEPQTASYMLHGDFWDYQYLNYESKYKDGIYLPLTLELGSWNWVRKNPMQFFSKSGRFNPMRPHRTSRTLRRHIPLLEFCLKVIHSDALDSAPVLTADTTAKRKKTASTLLQVPAAVSAL
jgi:hypothetical protein